MTITYRSDNAPKMAINIYSTNKSIRTLQFEFPTPIFKLDDLLKIVETVFARTDGYTSANIWDMDTGEVYATIER